MRVGTTAWVFGLAISLGAAAGARAQSTPGDSESDRRARLHFDSARAYFDVGDYDAALREFEASYQTSGRPEILYNLYLSHERLGHLPEAVRYLERYLAEGAPENRATLEARLANLRTRVERGETQTSEPTTPVSEARAVEPPAVEISRQDPPSTSEREPPPPPSTSGPSALAIAGFAIATVGVVGAAVAGGITLAEDARLKSCAPACGSASVETISVSAPLTDAALGLALAGAALGVIGLLLPSGESNTSAASLEIAPLFAPGGERGTIAGLTIRGAL
jgi:tetratricopeptide (TPR) repeat protein